MFLTKGDGKVTLKDGEIITINSDFANFNTKTFVKVLKIINQTPSCKLKEKNKLYVIFENINSVDEALINLNIF